MRRLVLICSLLILVLVACEEGSMEQTPNDIEQEEIVNDEQTDDDVTEDDEEVDEENEEVADEESNSDTSISDENKSEPEKTNVEDVATDVIWAQIDEDYTYLKSVVGDGVTVNADNNTIEFNTEEASHTFEFLTGIKEEDLEFRFVEGEDSDRAIIGFAAIDYENEYSYVIEMIFNNIDGVWKLVGMDINK